MTNSQSVEQDGIVAGNIFAMLDNANRGVNRIYILPLVKTELGNTWYKFTCWKLHICNGQREVAKYSNFGPIDGYISETVQDRR